MPHFLDLTTFIYAKIREGVCFTVDGCIDQYKLHRYFSQDVLDQINCDEAKKVRRGRVSWEGDTYIIDEFGLVKDENGKPIPTHTQTTGGYRFDVLRKKVNGKDKIVKVAVLMLQAISGAKKPRAIKYHKYMPELPTILTNLTYIETTEAKEHISPSMKRFIFASQEELDGFCWTFDVSSLSGVAEVLHLPVSEVNLNGYKPRMPQNQPISAEYTLPIEISGKMFRFNKFGGVMTMKGGVWGRHYTPFLSAGKLKIAFPTGNGSQKTINVVNEMVKAYDGEYSKKRVLHIDENPYNLVYRNLWYKGCGRKPYF